MTTQSFIGLSSRTRGTLKPSAEVDGYGQCENCGSWHWFKSSCPEADLQELQKTLEQQAPSEPLKLADKT